MDYIKLNSDDWNDLNIVYKVLEYSSHPPSTRVSLVLENTSTGDTIHRTIANHQIEWLEAKDW
jgi:hypothetical protein